jgi:hypothetical protein
LFILILLVATSGFLWGKPSSARADGGKMLGSSTHGDLKITVFMDPSFPRVGMIDVSVLAEEVKTGRTRLDLPVFVHAEQKTDPEQQAAIVASAMGLACSPETRRLAPWTLGTINEPKRRIGGQATNAAAVNKPAKGLHLELPEPGSWMIKVEVKVPGGTIRFQSPQEVAEALPAWMNYAGWMVWPLAVGLVLVAHRYLLRRRTPRLGRIPGTK